MSISRLFYTVRYLKPIQVSNRFSRRLHKPSLYRGGHLDVAKPTRSWISGAPSRQSIVSNTEACFLNETGPLADWENPDKSKLWLYNLHYFDDLMSENAEDRAELHVQIINHWIDKNAPNSGTGWEPYPLSLRTCNWVKWLLQGNVASEDMHNSLVEQVHSLSQQVEHHLLGNHILANAKALVFAGTFFEGESAQRWLQMGFRILDKQLPEQILEDGAHFELSPMYHSIILTDVLDFVQLGRLFPGSEMGRRLGGMEKVATQMLRWLAGVLHPDGEIPFFNDSAFGIASSPEGLFSYAEGLGLHRPELKEEVNHYESSGYVAVNYDEQYAIIDAADIGPDYLPGHAHADTLSFEWSLRGHRVLVNSGTSVYGISDERLRQRKTSSHNTVEVNGKDSSEVWSGFRVARRAKCFDVKTGGSRDEVSVSASHDGYRRLHAGIVHRREWKFSQGLVTIEDTIEGKAESAIAYIHFHPQVKVVLGNNVIALILPDRSLCNMTVEGGTMELLDSSWHPEFGVSKLNKRLAIRFSGCHLKTSLTY